MSDDSDTDAPAQADTKRPWFEPACAILMAVSSLATAWCSYQNSRWSGRSGALGDEANQLLRQADTMHIESKEIQSAQLRLVMEVVDSTLAGDEKRVRFYTDRFPENLRSAYDKWIALKPFDDPKAPPHPFVPSLYTPEFDREIRSIRERAAEAEGQSTATGKAAADYLGNTVIFATVLFFAGTAGRFDQRHVRWASLTFAVALCLFALIRMLLLPVA